MISVYKYILLKIRRHFKLELTSIFLCLLLFVMAISLVSNRQTAFYVKEFQQTKYENYYITQQPYKNDVYKDYGLDENIVAFYMQERTLIKDGKNYRSIPMAIMETKILEHFSPQIKDEYSDAENVAIKVYASFKLKEKYPLGEECSFSALKNIKGTVVGYNYGEFMLLPDNNGATLAGLWSTEPEIMAFVDDISIIDSGYYAICDIPASKLATLDPYQFISIKEQAKKLNDGSLQAFYFYVILAVVLASILVYSINHLLFSETLKKEIALECLVGATKKSMIIANAVLLALESIVTATLYYLIYSLMVKSGLIYSSGFALGLIPFIFIIFLAMFVARVVNILRNKLLPNLHADGD